MTGIRGVWLQEAGGANLFTVVSIIQQYPGHATQVGMVAGQCAVGATNGRFVVVDDDDIDPANLQAVIWAICTRSDPARSMQLIRRSFSSPIDTGVLPGEIHNSRMMIDACKPYERIRSFLAAVKVDAGRMESAKKKWGFLLNSKR